MANVVSPAAGSNSRNTLYARDFYSWALNQANALKQRSVEELDWENLAEEVEDLARRDADSLRNQLARLSAHLLKWQLQPSKRSNSWRGSVRGARKEVRHLLDTSPGLKSRLPELFENGYKRGVDLAIEETNLVPSIFPESPAWPYEQAMNDDFWPNSGGQPSRPGPKRIKKTSSRL